MLLAIAHIVVVAAAAVVMIAVHTDIGVSHMITDIVITNIVPWNKITVTKCFTVIVGIITTIAIIVITFAWLMSFKKLFFIAVVMRKRL